MQKTFLGSELVQEKDKQKALKKASMPLSRRAMKVLLGVIVGLVVWNLPSSVFGIDNLTVIEQRVIALFCFATIMWITEGIPSWATSVAIIVVLLFTASDNSLCLFRLHADENPLFGTLMSSKKIMACFADPVIMLFIGGFMLAFAATKAGLDIKLAKAKQLYRTLWLQRRAASRIRPGNMPPDRSTGSSLKASRNVIRTSCLNGQKNSSK